MGWARYFWQGSTDHRGVPGAPGRVATLVPEAGATCWGVAYRLEASSAAATLAALDHRERGGYAHHRLPIHAPRWSAEALVYVATPANDNWLGPAPIERIAAQVRASHGPSGPNDEYVLRLAAALREMSVEDAHVAGLAALLGG